MTKKEGQSVKKGELLAKIDDSDFKVAKQKLLNSIKSLQHKIKAKEIKLKRVTKELELNSKIAKNNILLYEKKIEALNLAIKADESRLKKLNLDEKRYAKMLKQKLISKGDYEVIQTQKNSLFDAIRAKKKEIEATKIELNNINDAYKISKAKKLQIDELKSEIEAYRAQKASLLDSLTEIENKISYTSLFSPNNLKVAKKFVNTNSVIEAGYPVYSLINPNDLHIEVLLSEKKLRGVKVGNEAYILLDANGKRYDGEVESILPTSAATFSLVPRDIASGEFTKLDQRFVVRVKLDNIDGLLAGMSAKIVIKRAN